ncbi:MAG: RING finger protein [Candidatus Heimdallarchaeota archaeon]
MKMQVAMFTAYFSSSFAVFLANPYQLENTAERVGNSLDWPLIIPYLAFAYYLGHSFPDHVATSTILPIAVFLLISMLAVVLWFFTQPPVTPIEHILQRHADWTINNTSDGDPVATEILLPQVEETEVVEHSERLNFRVRTRQIENMCAICRSPVLQDPDCISCPACDSPFHYSHFAEWVKVKGFCPVCRTEIIAFHE